MLAAIDGPSANWVAFLFAFALVLFVIAALINVAPKAKQQHVGLGWLGLAAVATVWFWQALAVASH